jgi:4-amino-4-deoxy-L-arabinose transferase-like glycosyltransferase
MLASHRSYRLVLCALVAAALYFPGLGRPALWEPDEGRYAEIAREMVTSGDYVTPHNDFELYFEKPPLVYWCEAAAIHLFGPSEFAVRLPAALFSIGQVVVTAAIADAMFGASAGLLGSMVLALSPLVFAFARFATLDPALAFFLTAAMGAFYSAARCGDLRRRPARRWILASAAMLALGTLAKGPVALVLGGAIAAIWLAAEGRLRDGFRMPLLSCALIYTAIVAPWFVLAEFRNPGFLRFFFIHEHFQRYVASHEHGWGPWFFIPIVIGGMLPWIFFAPLGWSDLHADDAIDSPVHRSDARFLAIWFAVIFVFFSIPRSKLGTYILPAMPPLAIFAGYWLSRLRSISAERRVRRLKYFAIANIAVGVIGAVVSIAIIPPAQHLLAVDAAIIATVIAGGAVLMYAFCRDAIRVPFGIAAMALAMVATVGLAEVMRRQAAPLNTYRNLAHSVELYVADDCVLASYRHYIQSLPFYTHRRETRAVYWGELSEVLVSTNVKSPFLIGSDARLREVWASSSCFILIANIRDLPELRRLLTPAPAIVGCEGKKFALYNRPSRGQPLLPSQDTHDGRCENSNFLTGH